LFSLDLVSVERRADILKRLIRWEEPLVRLGASDLLRVIDRFLAGDIDAQQLQDWAERLECREDIGFGPDDEQLVDDVFFRLATPFINEPLTHETVSRMREQLCASKI
jgi:hypothetical protein